MNQPYLTLVKLLAGCAATLLSLPGAAHATDATYGGSSTLIESGVDLRDHVEAGTLPPLALDAYANAWVLTTKNRAYPTLQRIDSAGHLANLFPLTTLPLPAAATLTSTANGEFALCSLARGSFDVQMLRLRVDAASVASLRSQTAARVPAPTTTVDLVTGVSRDVTISTPRCLLAADGSVLMHYQKMGSIGNTLVLHRFNADGSPDASFGTAGIMQSSGMFASGQTVQLGVVTLVWVAASGAIHFVSEGALLRQTANSPVLHPVSLTRIAPPSAAVATWQITQSDLSFTVPSFAVFPLAQFADGDDIVFFSQSFGFGANARGYLRRVNSRTGAPLFTVEDVVLPSFGPAQSFARVVLVNGSYLVLGGNGAFQPAGTPDRTVRNTTWIKRFGVGSAVQSVAGGIALDTISGEIQITPLPTGGFLLAAAAIPRRDGALAAPGILRFEPDYLLPRSVEFRDPQRDTYFFSANTDEIEQVWAWIRSAVLPWQGPHEFSDAQSFKTWPADAPVGSTLRVCRFFIPSLGTHFYSAREDECIRYSQAPFAGTFVAEDPQFRVVATAFDLGLCVNDKATIWRVFRPAPRALNHRWVVGVDAAIALRGQGWLIEGRVFCQPQ